MAERQRIPTWFGPEDRPLFGWIHVPDHPTGRGVVLCPSIGLEGEASQFAYRPLAEGLCDDGCVVLQVRLPRDGGLDGTPLGAGPAVRVDRRHRGGHGLPPCGRRHPDAPGRGATRCGTGRPGGRGGRRPGVVDPLVPVDQGEPVPALPAGAAAAVRGGRRLRCPSGRDRDPRFRPRRRHHRRPEGARHGEGRTRTSRIGPGDRRR